MEVTTEASERPLDRVVRFWDDVVAAFLDGAFPLDSPLDRWFDSYEGAGAGAVDTEAFPEAYGGDISGDIRAVFLALNPGASVPEFQYRDGIFANEIRRLGSYRTFAATFPYNRDPWIDKHGKNRHVMSLIAFVRDWFGNPSLSDRNFLTFELFPWHSRRVTGFMNPPRDIIEEFIWEPIRDLHVPFTFAFGSWWFNNLEKLGLRRLAWLGHGGDPYPTQVKPKAYRGAKVFEGRGDSLVVVVKQSGSARPPKASEVTILKEALRKQGLAVPE